jgi:hypothetical protein
MAQHPVEEGGGGGWAAQLTINEDKNRVEISGAMFVFVSTVGLRAGCATGVPPPGGEYETIEGFFVAL